VATPPSANRAAQQRRLDAFRLDFNQQGPHEALGQTPPGRQYQPSLRPYPSRLEDPAYPADCELRGPAAWPITSAPEIAATSAAAPRPISEAVALFLHT